MLERGSGIQGSGEKERHEGDGNRLDVTLGRAIDRRRQGATGDEEFENARDRQARLLQDVKM